MTGYRYQGSPLHAICSENSITNVDLLINWINENGIRVIATTLKEELNKDLSNQVKKEVTKAKCATVPLTQDDVDNFYFGFSNKTLWPLFHYFMEYTEFENDQWEAYKTVNQKFANVVLENINNPGNLGTIIRTALAFGFDAVITKACN